MEEEYIELIPVEGYTTLGRDPSSNAILNTDTTQYDAYIKARKNAKKKDRTLQDLKNEVEELKRLVNDLVRKEDK
jgi:predicted AlkP superfamily phosphohydrolase/phosphomutase|tara:strand:- start:32 stop:256 length:225 start_codon:yes stop_codon:yes gene_type:complete